MNLDLVQLFNFKASSDLLEKLMESYDNEIKEDEKTLKELQEIKQRYEKNASPDLLIPYDKILREAEDYKSLLILAANCSEIQKEITNYNKKYKEFFNTYIEIKRIKKLYEFNEDTYNLINTTKNLWDQVKSLDLQFLESGKSTFQAFMYNQLETLFKNFEAPNNNVLNSVLKMVNLPYKSSNKKGLDDQDDILIDKEYQQIIPYYIRKLVQIDHVMNGIIPEKMYFTRVFSESIIVAINFHFLGDKETNEPSKPEWFFDYLQDTFENNVSRYASIFKKGKREESVLLFMLNLFQKICLNPIIIRFKQDKETFLMDDDLLSHFITKLETLESCLEKYCQNYIIQQENTQLAESRFLPYILEKVLLTNEESILNLVINKEFKIFDEKILQPILKVDMRELQPRYATEKNFEIFPIVEDYTLLFAKTVKKYGFIKDATLKNKVKEIFQEQFFNKFMENMHTIFEQISDNSDDITLQLNEYFRKVYNVLRQYQENNPLGGKENDLKVLKKFKQECIEQVVFKFSDPIIKSSLRDTKKLVNSTYFKYFTHPKIVEETDVDVNELKTQIFETLVNPLKQLQKKISIKSFKYVINKLLKDFEDFVFNQIFKSYTKFSIFGIEFLIDSVFFVILDTIQTSIENLPNVDFEKPKEKLIEIEKCASMDKKKLNLMLSAEQSEVLSLHFKLLKKEEIQILERINLINV
ncbi:hypothetical protein ABPG74_009280 [Tetrahymena malaccensis]